MIGLPLGKYLEHAWKRLDLMLNHGRTVVYVETASQDTLFFGTFIFLLLAFTQLKADSKHHIPVRKYLVAQSMIQDATRRLSILSHPLLGNRLNYANHQTRHRQSPIRSKHHHP
jgi:hypothetical protein